VRQTPDRAYRQDKPRLAWCDVNYHVRGMVGCVAYRRHGKQHQAARQVRVREETVTCEPCIRARAAAKDAILSAAKGDAQGLTNAAERVMIAIGDKLNITDRALLHGGIEQKKRKG